MQKQNALNCLKIHCSWKKKFKGWYFVKKIRFKIPREVLQSQPLHQSPWLWVEESLGITSVNLLKCSSLVFCLKVPRNKCLYFWELKTSAVNCSTNLLLSTLTWLIQSSPRTRLYDAFEYLDVLLSLRSEGEKRQHQ